MKKTAILFGSTSGNCQSIAEKIAEKLGLSATDILPATQLTPALIAENQNLILGSSTWGCGELQDDWYQPLETLRNSDLSGKTVAIFGCGDSCGFSTTFCNAMAELHRAATQAGAKIIGQVPTEGYTFDDSEALQDGQFIGLPLDEDNESQLTDTRIEAWVNTLKPQL